MTTLPTDNAHALCRIRNRASVAPQWVVVDGPQDNEATVMSLREAVENDFAYSWEV